MDDCVSRLFTLCRVQSYYFSVMAGAYYQIALTLLLQSLIPFDKRRASAEERHVQTRKEVPPRENHTRHNSMLNTTRRRIAAEVQTSQYSRM